MFLHCRKGRPRRPAEGNVGLGYSGCLINGRNPSPARLRGPGNGTLSAAPRSSSGSLPGWVSPCSPPLSTALLSVLTRGFLALRAVWLLICFGAWLKLRFCLTQRCICLHRADSGSVLTLVPEEGEGGGEGSAVTWNKQQPEPPRVWGERQ